MTDREPVIPFHQLPRGFLELLDDPPDPPVFPRPSSTLVLLRKGRGGGVKPRGLEVLLLKRSPRSGFIPGAWVFPGGTVDEEDRDPAILPRLAGLSPHMAEERFELGNRKQSVRDQEPPAGSSGPPAWAYWVAAIRETFEETGVLLWAKGGDGLVDERAGGDREADGPREGAVAWGRSRLLAGEDGFPEVLSELGIGLDAGSLEYNGHWLTPECEPRRYETRFFATEVSPEVEVTPYERELVEALWITPQEALERNREGGFPLVFPTLFTLEELKPFTTPAAALQFLRDRPVPRRLPAPERREHGVVFKLAP